MLQKGTVAWTQESISRTSTILPPDLPFTAIRYMPQALYRSSETDKISRCIYNISTDVLPEYPSTRTIY